VTISCSSGRTGVRFMVPPCFLDSLLIELPVFQLKCRNPDTETRSTGVRRSRKLFYSFMRRFWIKPQTVNPVMKWRRDQKRFFPPKSTFASNARRKLLAAR